MGVLAFFVLLLGIWPAPLLDVMNATIDHLVAHIAQSKLPAL
jgi:NADH-quinone oxidoreductase subunit M